MFLIAAELAAMRRAAPLLLDAHLRIIPVSGAREGPRLDRPRMEKVPLVPHVNVGMAVLLQLKGA